MRWAQKNKLYHMGIRATVSRSTLADASERRDWRIYADFAQSLIRIARPLMQTKTLGLISTTPFMHSTHRQSICVSPFFPGHCFRHLRECRQESDLDRHLSLCACVHHQEATRYQGSSLHTIQILSLTLFEKTPLEQLLMNSDYKDENNTIYNQLNLFDNLTGQ